MERLSYVVPCQCPPGEHLAWQRRDLMDFVSHLNEIYLVKPKPLPEPVTDWPPRWRPREGDR